MQEDWRYTNGCIWDGKPVTGSYTYLVSDWATPVLVIDGVEYACWVYAENTKWTENTKWPK